MNIVDCNASRAKLAIESLKDMLLEELVWPK